MSHDADFHAFRSKGLGGTDAAAILGCSPWASEWDVYAAKRWPSTTDRSNAAMDTGTRLEVVVGLWAAEELGGTYTPVDRIVHPTHPELRGNTDGVILLRGGGVASIEIKVAGGAEWDPDNLPAHYRAQVDHYRWIFKAISGTDEPWYLAVFHRSIPSWRLYLVEQDPEWPAKADRLVAWWARFVVGDEVPDVDGSAACARALKALYPDHDGSIGDYDIATPEAIELAERHEHLKRLATTVIAEKDTTANKLRSLIGSSPGIRWADGKVSISKKGRMTVRISED